MSKVNKDSKNDQQNLFKCLVCPISRNPLRFNGETQELISDSAAVAFPVRKGIPILLIDEARKID